LYGLYINIPEKQLLFAWLFSGGCMITRVSTALLVFYSLNVLSHITY